MLKFYHPIQHGLCGYGGSDRADITVVRHNIDIQPFPAIVNSIPVSVRSVYHFWMDVLEEVSFDLDPAPKRF